MAYRYALPQRLLHWTVAGLALISLTTGLLLGWLGFEGARDALGLAATNTLYTAHKSVGVLILLAMLLRVLARLGYGKPAYQHPLDPARRVASSAVHGLLYLLLIVQPVLGWLATAAGDFPVDFFGLRLPGLIGVDKALSETLYGWHGLVAWTILGLVILHVAAALHHWRVLQDGVMQRMSLR
ncbi:cytochrome b [Sediminicurvatus halobius]|uniref:Cytochrome B n=1 Tax=Sediminicurvatus halobius TaxID=2182432 RepID=A0A2U2MYL7_9GAMM|nr:cytochrome b [Spiribacter halobius]PWG61893.1 cytochrome B [Spiribacter halobius]UEX79231.1 cytochrome b [Spiribacter halobius]